MTGDRVREQRKVVTALFADIVGSTSLGEALDPEDVMEIVGGAITRMIDPVEGFGGTVKDLAGDGILALFGAPVAHEDDAERALLAAFAILETIGEYSREARDIRGRPPLNVRVGVESGVVAVGLVGGGSRVELGAVGDAVNTAARLQSAAAPGTVLVGSGTFALIEELFEWEDPIPLRLKGKAEPVNAHRAVRPARAPAISPRRGARDVPLVGRERELQMLEVVAARLLDRRGGVVLVTGEPGIGKSRLLDELRTRLAGDAAGSAGPVQWLEGRCRSYGETVPYGPVRDMFRRWVDGLTDEVAEVDGLAPLRIRSSGGRSRDLADAMATLLELLRDKGASALPPEELQRRIHDTAVSVVEGMSDEPLVVAVEDLHWADASSIHLVEHLLPLARRRPVLFVLSARDEGAWHSLRSVAASELGEVFLEVPLAALDEADVGRLLAGLLGSAFDFDGVQEKLLETTAGNPFFVEELVRALSDMGALFRDGDRWRLADSVAAVVPPTVEQVLMTRIDALSPRAHEALTAAAVVGTPFNLRLLEAVTGDGDLEVAVAELERSDLVRLDEDRPGEYRFKHALIGETAYASLLRRHRKHLHGATARALQDLSPGGLDEISAPLARHLFEAGDLRGAHENAITAGDSARAKFANAEAITLYTLALEAGLAARSGCDGSDLRVDVAAERLGDVLELVGRHDDARAAFARALDEVASHAPVAAACLRRRLGDTFQAQYRNEEALDQYQLALDILDRVLSSDRNEAWRRGWLNIGLERMAAYYWIGDVESMATIELEVGSLVRKDGTTDQVLRYALLAKDLRLRQTAFRIDDETMSLARAHLDAAVELGDAKAIASAQFEVAFCHLFALEFDAASCLFEQAITGLARVGDAIGHVRSVAYYSLLLRMQGLENQTARACDQLVGASRAAGLSIYLPIEAANRAWLAWRAGDPSSARSLARKALDGWAAERIASPFEWSARWVLLALAADDRDLVGAMQQVAGILAPGQQALSPEVVEELRAAEVGASEADDPWAHIDAAVRLARNFGFL